MVLIEPRSHEGHEENAMAVQGQVKKSLQSNEPDEPFYNRRDCARGVRFDSFQMSRPEAFHAPNIKTDRKRLTCVIDYTAGLPLMICLKHVKGQRVKKPTRACPLSELRGSLRFVLASTHFLNRRAISPAILGACFN